MPARRLTDDYSWKQLADKVMIEASIKSNRFKKWFMGKEKLGGLFFNSFWYYRLYNIRKALMLEDGDHFICIAGKEGTGKSTLGNQSAAVLSKNFQLKHICYRPLDFIKGIRYSEPGDTFILDEGNLFLFSRESMKDDNKWMVKLFALMRQRNLCVIICVPNFFTLDSYVRNHRVDTLIYLHRKGQFTCFKGKAIRIISKEGSKFKNIAGIKVPYGTFFRGHFNREFPRINDVSIEAYRAHKGENFDLFLDEVEEAIRKRDEQPEWLSISQAKKIVPLNEDTYIKKIKSGELKGKKIGGKYFIDRIALLR